MKIKIEKIEDDIVYIDTGYGVAKGLWQGNNPPTLSEYHVSLKPRGKYHFEDFQVSKTEGYHINIVGNINIMVFTIICYEEEGWLLAQFGDSSLFITIEKDERFNQLYNKYLIIEIDDLYIYDQNVPANVTCYDMNVPEVARKYREKEDRLEKERIKEAWRARKGQLEEERELKRKDNIKFLIEELVVSTAIGIVVFAVILGLVYFFKYRGAEGSTATLGAGGLALVGYWQWKIGVVIDLVDEIKKSREWRRKKKKESDQMK